MCPTALTCKCGTNMAQPSIHRCSWKGVCAEAFPRSQSFRGWLVSWFSENSERLSCVISRLWFLSLDGRNFYHRLWALLCSHARPLFLAATMSLVTLPRPSSLATSYAQNRVPHPGFDWSEAVDTFLPQQNAEELTQEMYVPILARNRFDLTIMATVQRRGLLQRITRLFSSEKYGSFKLKCQKQPGDDTSLGEMSTSRNALRTTSYWRSKALWHKEVPAKRAQLIISFALSESIVTCWGNGFLYFPKETMVLAFVVREMLLNHFH